MYSNSPLRAVPKGTSANNAAIQTRNFHISKAAAKGFSRQDLAWTEEKNIAKWFEGMNKQHKMLPWLFNKVKPTLAMGGSLCVLIPLLYYSARPFLDDFWRLQMRKNYGERYAPYEQFTGEQEYEPISLFGPTVADERKRYSDPEILADNALSGQHPYYWDQWALSMTDKEAKSRYYK
mmetsp:Transcript_1318/g.1490  ORF Transcript_1318/g.1490 Transcript_1318/m.1490 type:complete len:178 (+) Transcript_1318:1-534(+)